MVFEAPKIDHKLFYQVVTRGRKREREGIHVGMSKAPWNNSEDGSERTDIYNLLGFGRCW